MSRRVALAFSLVLTIVTGFALASLGTQAGWFSASASTPDAEAIAPTEAPTIEAPAGPLAAIPDPIVVTDYVVVDKPIYRTTTPANAPAPSSNTAEPTAAPPSPTATGLGTAAVAPSSQESSAPRTATSRVPSTLSAPRMDDDDDEDEDEHEDEDDDEEDEDEDEHEDEDD